MSACGTTHFKVTEIFVDAAAFLLLSCKTAIKIAFQLVS